MTPLAELREAQHAGQDQAVLQLVEQGRYRPARRSHVDIGSWTPLPGPKRGQDRPEVLSSASMSARRSFHRDTLLGKQAGQAATDLGRCWRALASGLLRGQTTAALLDPEPFRLRGCFATHWYRGWKIRGSRQGRSARSCLPGA